MRRCVDTKDAILACYIRPRFESSSLKKKKKKPSIDQFFFLVVKFHTLTVLGDSDRVPRVERVKCVLKGARINDLFDTGGLCIFEDVLRSAACRFYSRSCLFVSLSTYGGRACNNKCADIYRTERKKRSERSIKRKDVTNLERCLSNRYGRDP